MEFQKIKLQMIKETSAIYTAEKITAPADIVALVNKYEQYDLTPTEKIIVIGLDTKNQVNIYTEIATGTSSYANFNITEIFKPLLVSNSSKFIVAHNHPSGDATPSKEDLNITNKIEVAASIIGIHFLDHIIIGNNDYTSILSYKINKERNE